MRLLNTKTLHFKEFLGDDIPPYAIVSHVWSAQELSYQDFLAGRGKDFYGYEKITKLCELSQSFEDDMHLNPLEYCWIDTICINKESSAELSEAINSMYAWYEKAKVCFVFLPDVEPLPLDDLHKQNQTIVSGVAFYEYQFVESRWFTRGWTLQELVAPSNVLFLNTSYEFIGQKGVATNSFRPLTDLIQKASGIRISSLLGRLSSNPRDVCIAQKMSWASKRRTTRAEDIAYCLLGIFGVNLPLLYGEGAANAFLRLQEAIITRSTDQSIFAWETDELAQQPWSGLLARHPKAFWNCSDMYTVREEGPQISTTYNITQRGLELVVPLDQTLRPRSGTTWCFLYPLSCCRLRKPWFKCYLKIWVEEVTMDGRKYADGFKLAWRSGIITLEFEEPGFRGRRNQKTDAVEVKAMNEALGWATPNLLEFNSMEWNLYDIVIQRDPGNASTKSWRDPVRQMLVKLVKLASINPTREPNLVKLYFKTHFTSGETPIATALLRSLT